MGLFGKQGALANLFGDGASWGDTFAAAQAQLAGDAAGASRIHAAASERNRERKKAEAERAQLQQIYHAIDQDPNLPTPEAKSWARMNPKAYADVMLQRFQTRQFGPGGGSVMTPGANGPQWQQAPSRHEFQGSVYDVGPSAPGQKATVTPQHEGTQWVTPQPGTTAFGVNSFSGVPRAGAPAPAAPDGGPQPGTIEDGYMFKGGDPADPASWVPVAQGGPGRTAPATFPGPR